MDAGGFYQRDNLIAGFHSQFLASLLGNQRGNLKTTVELNPHQNSFPGDRLDGRCQMVARAGGPIRTMQKDHIIGADADVDLYRSRRQMRIKGGKFSAFHSNGGEALGNMDDSSR